MSVKAGRVQPLLQRAHSLDELRAMLRAEGIRAPRSAARLRSGLRKAWARANADVIEQVLLREPEELDDLPFTEAVRGGVTYRIHGVVHPQDRFGVHMRPDVRARITTIVAAYECAPEEDYVLEPRFGRTFGLPPHKELTPIRPVLRRLGRVRTVLFVLAALAAIPLLPLAPLLVRRLVRDPVTRRMYACLDNLGHLPVARELFRLSREIPQPIDLQSALATRVPFAPLMSVEMAREAIERAHRTPDLRVMHVVVGIGHETQIASCIADGVLM